VIVLHAAPIDWQQIGGLTVSIPALVESQNRLDGVTAGMAVTVANGKERPQMEFPVFYREIRLAGDGRLDLPAPFDRPNLVVFHSTYIPAHAVIAAKLRKASIPYVICPRGGMTRYAQRYRWWKKRIGNLLFFNKLVARAAAVNCLTHGEAEATRGWNRPTFVVGNGVRIPPLSEAASSGQVGSPERAAGLRLVFIGRLHIEYKGLDVLLEACRLAQVELRRAGAGVELYGPDCGGSAKLLAGRIAALRLEDVVSLHGPVLGKAKTRLLSQADVFLHPSRSEGHPVAVLEALAHGLPCLLTPVTNMAEEVAAAGAGWRVGPSADSVAAGIVKVLSTDAAQLQRAGAAARRLAVENYSWEKTAARSLQQYRKCAA